MSEDVVATGVVVGADGSEAGNAALRWAADASAAHHLPLTAVHARPDVEGVVQEIRGGSDVLSAAAEVVRPRHPELTVRTLQYPEPPVQTSLVAGETADFIVIGSRGLGGFGGSWWDRRRCRWRRTLPVRLSSCMLNARTRPTVRTPETSSSAMTAQLPPTGLPPSPSVTRAPSAVPWSWCRSILVGATQRSTTCRPEGRCRVRTPEPSRPLLVTAESFPDVPVKFVAGTGRPAEVLIQESRGCELLVVGPRGRGGFAGLIMGSVSQKVLAHAATPVAFVHAGTPAKAAAGLPD